MGEAIPPERKPAAPKTALASPACLRAAFIAMAVEGARMRPKLPIMANRQNSKNQGDALRYSAVDTQIAEINNAVKL